MIQLTTPIRYADVIYKLLIIHILGVINWDFIYQSAPEDILFA